jgi:RNA polymerase sigma-70 factor (ECF subfamily)
MQRELVERAMGGDRDAFDVIIHASASRQYAVASLIMRDRHRAEDAVQDALVAAWKGLGALREPDAFEAWLHRLTVRSCFAILKRDKRRRLLEREVAPDPATMSEPDSSSAVAERDRVERALARLPADQRAVVVLHFHMGLPLTEVAEIVEVPAGTAKSRLSRGLETLRRAMAAEPEARRATAVERSE